MWQKASNISRTISDHEYHETSFCFCPWNKWKLWNPWTELRFCNVQGLESKKLHPKLPYELQYSPWKDGEHHPLLLNLQTRKSQDFRVWSVRAVYTEIQHGLPTSQKLNEQITFPFRRLYPPKSSKVPSWSFEPLQFFYFYFLFCARHDHLVLVFRIVCKYSKAWTGVRGSLGRWCELLVNWSWPISICALPHGLISWQYPSMG